MGLISRVSSRTYRYIFNLFGFNLFIMSKVKKTFEAALKDRIDSYDDQELRTECIDAGLKPGPVNHQTRSGWAKRLLSKRMKEARPAKPEEPKEITAEFSADEEAINGEVIENGETSVAADQSVPANTVKPEETKLEHLKDAEFSDDDAPVEEDDDKKCDEHTENKASESMVVNMSKTADTSSMEVEATISGEILEENKDESEEKCDEISKEIIEEKSEPKSEETPDENKLTENPECNKPASNDCKILCYLKSQLESACAYFEEHKQEIFELVVVLLIAYLLFRYKDDINDTFDKLNEQVGTFVKSVKEKASKRFSEIQQTSSPDNSIEVEDAVISSSDGVADTEPAE